MPWTSDDAERHTHRATTREQKELWAKVANDCLELTADEGRVIREVNAVVKRQVEVSCQPGFFALANQAGQASGTFVTSHFASAALTSAGRSWAIQWPEGMTTSVRSTQSRRIGSARRESIVSQV